MPTPLSLSAEIILFSLFSSLGKTGILLHFKAAWKTLMTLRTLPERKHWGGENKREPAPTPPPFLHYSSSYFQVYFLYLIGKWSRKSNQSSVTIWLGINFLRNHIVASADAACHVSRISKLIAPRGAFVVHKRNLDTNKDRFFSWGWEFALKLDIFD